MNKILTLCLFPFDDEPLWVIGETEVSSIGTIEENKGDACEGITTVETHPANDAAIALSRARSIARESRLALYMQTIHADAVSELTLIQRHD